MLTSTLAALLMGQGTKAKLSDFLQTHPPAKPWVAIETFAPGKPESLVSFDRKEVSVGGLTAVVPTTMVTIDDPTTATPDLYEGLPRDAKLLALMASLNSAEWRLLGGRGLGLGDLRGEPKAILASILPRPFRYKRYHKHGGVVYMGETENVTVPPKDVEATRLKLFRQLTLYVGMEGRGGTIGLSFENDAVRDGTFGEFDDTGEKDASYGVVLRRTEPNRPKKGGLRFEDRALDAQVGLPPATTIRQALTVVSRATGRSILSDLRVADLTVASSGGVFRAGDVLGALALAVTGTYRPVGPGFVLTSDLVGLGTRKARIERWRSGLARETEGRMAEWRRAVAAGGGMRAIGYPADAPLRADDALQQRIDAQGTDSPKPAVPVSSLPPEFRDALERRRDEYAKINEDMRFETERVGLQTSLRFGFRLPDGTEIKGGRLQPSPPARPNENPVPPIPDAPRGALPEGERAPPLLLVVENVEEARTAAAVAAAYGFRELWLETHDPAALREAVAKAARPVRLVIRPWTAPTGTKATDPDRTLLEDPARNVVARQLANASRRWSSPPDPPTPLGRELLAPGSVRIEGLAALARTSGLKGCVVLDTQPDGYLLGDPRLTTVAESFGYSGSLRWAFLQKHGLDPVDIVPSDGSNDIELRQPFFPDNELMSLTAINDEGRRDEPEAQANAAVHWSAFRAEANRKATEALLASLGNLPIMVAVRREGLRDGRSNAPVLTAWRSGEPLPTKGTGNPNDPLPLALPFREPLPLGGAETRAALAHPERFPLGHVTFDLSDVRPSRWTDVLDRLLKRRSER